MKKKSAWLIVLALLATLYFLSSIPGLRVLPVLSTINAIMVSLDLTFVRFSEWLAAQVPGDVAELYFIDKVTRDFLDYARDNPVIIEFLLRKLAHVVVFFVITIALFFLIYQYIKGPTAAVILSFVAGGIVASLDEYRQTFVDGRHGSIVDVFINMIGVSLAICLIMFSLFITSSGRKRLMKEAASQGDEAAQDAGEAAISGDAALESHESEDGSTGLEDTGSDDGKTPKTLNEEDSKDVKRDS